MKLCYANGCDRAAYSKGLCLMHYKRMRKHGDPNREYTPYRRPLIDRFMEKVSKDPTTGCWNWTGSKFPKGYGAINLGGAGPVRTAHRVAYKLLVGPIPKGDGVHGTCVCHRCDNPACVNPDHLFLGSVADNNKDMWRKGRGKAGYPKGHPRNNDGMLRGERHPMATMTDAEALALRSRLRAGIPTRVLARETGRSMSNLWAIKAGKIWRHLKEAT